MDETPALSDVGVFITVSNFAIGAPWVRAHADAATTVQIEHERHHSRLGWYK